VTDLVSERQWLGSEIGLMMRAQWGRNHQLAIPVLAERAGTGSTAPPRESAVHWVWVFGRTHQDFSRYDREVAAAVQPVLDATTHQFLATRAGIDVLMASSMCLTNRELAVLQLLGQRCAPLAISRRLGISVRTVHKHLERIYRKLEVRDHHAAVTAVIALGVLTPTSEKQ
jgi:DNA-binding CsgD family transcriptional regulator